MVRVVNYPWGVIVTSHELVYWLFCSQNRNMTATNVITATGIGIVVPIQEGLHSLTRSCHNDNGTLVIDRMYGLAWRQIAYFSKRTLANMEMEKARQISGSWYRDSLVGPEDSNPDYVIERAWDRFLADKCFWDEHRCLYFWWMFN